MTALPFDPMRPFTRAEALAGGWTAWQLRGREVARLHRNVYVSRRATRTLSLRTRAALLTAPPGTTASHETAALLWGGSVPPTSLLHVRVPRARRSGSTGSWPIEGGRSGRCGGTAESR